MSGLNQCALISEDIRFTKADSGYRDCIRPVEGGRADCESGTGMRQAGMECWEHMRRRCLEATLKNPEWGG